MGWGPCGRSLGHWYSIRERGTTFAFCNVAHNVGGGLTGVIAAYSTAWLGWRYAFFVPGVLARLCAAANFFVYIARYAMLDWGPTYLKEVKRASLESGGFSTAIFEFAGIFSTLLMGWISDKAGGRRGMVSLLCMVPVLVAFAAILYTPPGMLWLDLSLFAVVGFFVYPPVMLLGVTGLDFTSKKAVGAALFGYLGRTVQGKALGLIAERYGWNIALWWILGATFAGILFLSVTWKLTPRNARV